jgi:hypothetical protein
MREWLWAAIVGTATALVPSAGHAQAPATVAVAGPVRMNGYFEAPGFYGTSWGVASYRVPRLYSEFASPFGVGYGYGYAPYGLIPGRYGTGLWRPGAVVAPGYVYGASPYQTWAVPNVPGISSPLPSIGLYAPGFGSTGVVSW